jgi:Peptidase U49
MAELVENFDPEKLDSPIRGLLKNFATSPFKIAPERQDELDQLVKKHHLRIWIDATTDLFNVHISELLRRVSIPLSALERLWAYAYCYSLFFDLAQPEAQGRVIDLRAAEDTDRVRRLMVWANNAEITGKSDKWPENTPRPDQNESDPSLKPANQIFLMMSGFILLHEVAHLRLGHCEHPAVSADESIASEFAADRWAAEWVLAHWQKYNNGERVFIQRTVGIAFALAAIGGIELYTPKHGTRTHPNAAARLLDFLDRWVPHGSENVLPARQAAWKVAPSVLHVHLLKLGKITDPSAHYPTFRDYLCAAEQLF